MNDKNKTPYLVWIVIGLCTLAIPIALFTNSTKSNSKESDGLFGAFKSDRIKVIRLEGPIMDSAKASVFSLPKGAKATLKQLRKAKKDKKIKGVLLRINSPGGTIGASQELNQAVKALKKEKPVIASMGDMAASGGYYVACACDKIFANPGTMTGSIGVIMSMVNIKSLAEKIGVEPKVVKSGPFKDIASMYRPMSDAEKKLLQALIDDAYDQFVSAVAQGRGMKKEEVKSLADGRIYTGRQALKVGLVDSLDSYPGALKELQKVVKEKNNLKEDLKVEDGSSSSFLSNLLSASNSLLNSFHNESSVVNEMIPLSLKTEFRNQPLWMLP